MRGAKIDTISKNGKTVYIVNVPGFRQYEAETWTEANIWAKLALIQKKIAALSEAAKE